MLKSNRQLSCLHASLMIAVLAIGCVEGIDDLDDGIDEGARSTVPARTIVWRALLTSVDPLNFPVRGDAAVTMVNGKPAFTAIITISDDILGGLRSWHVNVGTCLTRGGIVGEVWDYPRFFVGLSGEAAAIAVVRVGLDLATPYHVDVHESNEDFDRLIACGQLFRQ